MTATSERFPYVEVEPALGVASAMPYVPIALERDGQAVQVSALIDSGAALSVLPLDVGLQLGAVWDEQAIPVRLGGNLAGSEARAILIMATIGSLEPVRPAFAWTRTNQVPVILGQVNFFMEFNVCFYGSQSAFEVSPDTSD